MPIPLDKLLALLFQSEVNRIEKESIADELRYVARTSGIPVSRIRQLFDELKQLVTSAARKKANIGDLFDSCDFLVDEADKETVQNWFAQHREAFSASLESHSSAATDVLAAGRSGGVERVSLAKVVDVDWRLVVSVASSESERQAVTHVQVRLSVADDQGASGASGGEGVRHVALEMTVAQFYGFLHELRKMKAALDAVTV